MTDYPEVKKKRKPREFINTCTMCGRDFTGKSPTTKVCDHCLPQSMKMARERQKRKRSLRGMQYKILHDPCEVKLGEDLIMPHETVRNMARFGSLVENTVLERQDGKTVIIRKGKINLQDKG